MKVSSHIYEIIEKKHELLGKITLSSVPVSGNLISIDYNGSLIDYQVLRTLFIDSAASDSLSFLQVLRQYRSKGNTNTLLMEGYIHSDYTPINISLYRNGEEYSATICSVPIMNYDSIKINYNCFKCREVIVQEEKIIVKSLDGDYVIDIDSFITAL